MKRNSHYVAIRYGRIKKQYPYSEKRAQEKKPLLTFEKRSRKRLICAA